MRVSGLLFRGREVDSCDVCLLLNLGLLTEDRAQIVNHPYLICTRLVILSHVALQRPEFRQEYFRTLQAVVR
jgi:hypothetical protein